ncbi:MAG TPA: beta-ketoacyl-ACP synthase II [Abditibacteriaceae bacterium]|jgi:3-oxoacyl-[acyl-carrier-protein] synthase II
MERVVITGMGAVTPLGTGVAKFWDGVKNARNGIKLITRVDTTRHIVKFAGEVDDFKVEEFVDKKEAKRMDRFVQLSMGASLEAMQDSGYKVDDSNAQRVGVIIGCGVGGLETWEKEYAKFMEFGPDRVSPFLIPMMITNMASGHVSIHTGARGPNTTLVSACSSSAHSIGAAFDIIRRGEADVMIAGGTEAPISNSGLAGFGNMRALSRNNEDYLHASRPFDLNRDGFVMGEGAGTIILESLTSAQARGAKIYGEMLSHGMNGDSYHMTNMPEDGRGIGGSMKLALDNAGLTLEDVGYVNAHGTSTPTNDKVETTAMKVVFGDRAPNVPISSTKSQIGHLLGGGSAVEFIATVLALKEQILPPTINYQTPDPECDLDYVPNAARPASFDVALCNSSGFGGHNATLVARRWTE